MSDQVNGKDESFRDSLATVDKEGKRIWIFPKKPSGKYYKWRSIVSYFLLALLFAGPFLRINGEPLLLLDVLGRKYVFFGQVFWPQDFYIFLFGMLTMVVFIIVFTVAFGRLFCGWVCPQTIFMEMLFRKIEYWIEGDWKHQQKLRKQPWNKEKIMKKGAKHAIFFAISFLIANTFLAYLIGSERLFEIITDDPRNHLARLGALLAFTAAFYGVFAKFREQVCTTVCPYGRLQGVLLDRDSVVVAYDHVRGESRGKFRKNEAREEAGKGDCIDCKACVHVCPTGIDIRNGTQLECINCTACMDACDHMMGSVGLEPELIRYASERQVADKKPFRWTGRMKAYSAVLVVLVGLLVTLLTTRTSVDTTLLRAQDANYSVVDEHTLKSLYNYKIINKTNKDIEIELRLEDAKGKVEVIGNNLTVQKQGLSEGALFIFLDKSEITDTKTDVKIGVYSNGERIETVSTEFIGPLKIG